MGESAWLVSDAHQVIMPLDKPIRRPDGSVHYFWPVPDADKRRALWKFIADYGDQPIRTVSGYDSDFTVVAGYFMIDEDGLDGGITYADYLAGWPG